MSRCCSSRALLPLHMLLCIFSLQCLHACSAASITAGTPDGSERWGYVEVRPEAHLFWWYYKSPQRTSMKPPSMPWPTVLWLQGGPGSSGVGIGNFMEIGPLDVNLQPRTWTWLQKADLIFVDNPVGVGYSYVEKNMNNDSSLLVTSDWQQAVDMITVLKAVLKELPTLQRSPVFLVGESYGGKYAATLGVPIARAVRDGELNVTLGGVVLGDSFISPEDFTLSYTALLRSVSRLDDNAAGEANKIAETVKEQIAVGNFSHATDSWKSLVDLILARSGNVSIYNFLLDNGMDPVSANNMQALRYSTYLGSQDSDGSNTINTIMNGVIKEKLKIIPKDLKWEESQPAVFNALANDMMKPRIDEVDELLSYGFNVTVYNGQLDIICSTIGAEAWVQKLKWDGLKTFLSLPRQSLYCGPSKETKGFVRSYKNLHFYWILGAGHYVPVDQPCIALSMIDNIIQ